MGVRTRRDHRGAFELLERAEGIGVLEIEGRTRREQLWVDEADQGAELARNLGAIVRATAFPGCDDGDLHG